MGYLHNHLATVVCGIFAASLSIAWPLLAAPFPTLHAVFVMAVPIAWFMVFTCWIAQKSTDYMHRPHAQHADAKQENHSKTAI